MQCWNRCWAFGLPQRVLRPGVFPRLGCQTRCQSELRTNGWEVSSLGRVRTASGVTHHGTLDASGYRRVHIAGKRYSVHRLVARVFHGPPPSTAHTHVNHINGHSANNAASNLEYATPSENVRHSWATSGRSTSWCKPIQYRSVGVRLWSSSSSQKEAARILGVGPSCISKCCKGRIRSAAGYEFQYAETEPLTGEVWLAAKYPGITCALSNWMVSSLGRVKTDSGRITHGTMRKAGYYAMSFSGKTARGPASLLMVHRLVAATFLGQPSSAGLQVNHLDGQRGNNVVRNLEYVTPAQNVQHANSRRAGSKTHRPNKCKRIFGRELTQPAGWLKFESILAASMHTGIASSSISNVCHGRRKYTRNWEFNFAPVEELPGEEWCEVILD